MAVLDRLVGKIKPILGTGAAGAVVGAILGGAVVGTTLLLAPAAVPIGTATSIIALMGAFGGFAGAGFAVMLALAPVEGSVGSLSLPKSGLQGAVAGALFPLAVAALSGGLLFPWEIGALAPLTGLFAVLGGGIAVGLVSVAKGVTRPRLGKAEDPRTTLPAGDEPLD